MRIVAGALTALAMAWLLLIAPSPAQGREFDQDQWRLHGSLGLFQDMTHSDRLLRLVSLGGEYSLFRDVSFGLEATGYFADMEGQELKGLGLGVTARWSFLRLGRVILFMDGSVSGTSFEKDTPPGGSRRNFMEQVGPGLAVPLSDSLFLVGGARYLHLSNGRERHNPGLDALGGHLGLLYAF